MKKSFSLFAAVCLAVVLSLGMRLVALLPLYQDANVRAQVRSALEHMAENEGFLLSGFSVRSIRADSITVLHREHARGSDTVRCYTVLLADSSYTPCDA